MRAWLVGVGLHDSFTLGKLTFTAIVAIGSGQLKAFASCLMFFLLSFRAP